jgi:YjbE family integral membrane protein
MELLSAATAIAAGSTDQWATWLASFFGSHALTALAIIKIVGINIILSGDNAVVIALACRGLPPRQRSIGIILGAAAAVIMRIIFTVIIQFLLGVPWLKLCGGLLLFWIAIKLVKGEEASEESVASGSSMFEAVKIVAIADIVMSLDNVLAIAAAAESAPAEQRIWLIILGLVISIPLVIAGSTLIMGLLTRFPILVWFGAALLGYVAAELIVTEPGLEAWVEGAAKSLGISEKVATRICEVMGALVVVIGGWLGTRTRSARAGHGAQ